MLDPTPEWLWPFAKGIGPHDLDCQCWRCTSRRLTNRVDALCVQHKELLEALEHAYAIFMEDSTLGNSVDYNDIRGHLEAAIRKARGKGDARPHA